MRVLFTCFPLLGHFLPLTPFARALAEAGHDVAFATPYHLRPTVEAAGFQWLRAGVEADDPELVAAHDRRNALRGRESTLVMIEQIFGDIWPRRLVPDVLALAEDWRPDVVVRETREYGGMLAAELLNVPHAKVEIHAAGILPKNTALLVEPIRRLRAHFGLPERSILALMEQYLVLTPFPPSLNKLGDPIPPTVHRYRGLPEARGADVLPGWLSAPRTRPLIYVSIGTIFSGWRGQEIFSKLLAGLRELEAEIVMTIGHDLDPATLGPQPEHIHLERFLSLSALLPRCDMALFHGGSGTLAPVVAHGLPMVILPLGADQPDNAARCEELGVSRSLDQHDLAPERIREVVLDVLRAPGYREAAERLRDEFDALPGVDCAVELLERLARDKAPIIASR